MMFRASLLLGLSWVVAQDPALSDQVRKIVDARYEDTSDEHRALVTSRLVAVLSGRPDVDSQKIDSFVEQLDQTLRYARSFVHPYDLRAQGSTSWPPLPQSMKSRQLDLELRWAETYFLDGLNARPLESGGRENITRQIDDLISQVRMIVAGRVVGPFAAEAIDAQLSNMRHHLLGTFDFPVSANFPRLMSPTEVEGILKKVRDSAEEMKGTLEVGESLKSLQRESMDPAMSAEARERRDQANQRYNEIVGTISRLSLPLYDLFDLWGPERARISSELKQLGKEVQSWYVENSASNRKAAREVPAPAPTVDSKPLSRPAPASSMPKRPTSPEPAKADPPAGSTSRRWTILAVVLLAVLAAGTLYRFASRRSNA